MKAFKLQPVFKDYIWGGDKLKKEFFKDSPFTKTAESWELSVHKDGESLIASGEFKGKRLSEVLTEDMIGKRLSGKLNVMIKLIDAADDLSVQVHPDDAYARTNENDSGKTEMWYIVNAESGAGIYCGFKGGIKGEQVSEKIHNGTLTDALNFFPCKKGDSFFIPSGTVHAIGKGLTVCEVQQSSNSTYRLYDYNRTDAKGQTRPLHIKKALDVLNLEPYKNFDKITEFASGDYTVNLISACPYFSVREYKSINGGSFVVDKDSFAAVSVLSGEGSIANIEVKKGDTVFISAGFGECSFTKNLEFLLTQG